MERDGSHLYDSAVLFSPDGELLLHYRRIQPQWHGAKADPAVYQQGDEISRAVTDFGRVVILICGDLFVDDICGQAKQHDPDLLLFPFARNFGDGSFDQQRWDREELGSYVARAARVGVTTAMVNGLADPAVSEYPSFGGAWVVSSDGTVLAKRPLGQPGTLLFDLA